MPSPNQNNLYQKKLEFKLNSQIKIKTLLEKMSATKKNKLWHQLNKLYKDMPSLDKIDFQDVSARIAKLNKPYNPYETVKFLNKKQLTSFFEAIKKEDGLRDQALFKLIYLYGMRATEACNLTLEDIDLENGQITIRGLKNGYKITSNLENETLKLLKKYLNVRPDSWDNHLFLSQKSKVGLSRIDIYRMFVKYAKMADLPADLQHPHSLRHTTATTLANKGITAEHAQKQLRHKNIQQTMIYYNITGEKLNQVIDSNLASLVGAIDFSLN